MSLTSFGCAKNQATIRFVPCPYFHPSELCDQSLFAFPARLPLGAGFRGHCCAPGHEGFTPSDAELRECNLGYPNCTRLPLERAADANRFFVAQSGGELNVTFCSERAHLPVEQARLICSSVDSVWTAAHQDACIQAQAEAAVRTFLQRRASRTPILPAEVPAQ